MIYRDLPHASEIEAQVRDMNRRAQAHNAAGRITSAQLRDCLMACAGRCEWCGTGVVNQQIEIDHIVSLVQGGSNTADNLAVACPSCNRIKADKHPVRFAQEIVARTGYRSKLVTHLLETHDMDVSIQSSLFESLEPDQADDLHSHQEQSSGNDDVPPYRW